MSITATTISSSKWLRKTVSIKFGMQTSLTDPALWRRIHFGYDYLSLSITQLTMGLAWFLVYWNGGSENRRRKIQSGDAVLGQDFWSESRRGCRHRDSQWNSNSGQTGRLSPSTPGRSLARLWPWRDVRILSRNRLHWRIYLGRKKAWTTPPLSRNDWRRHRQLALRSFYLGYKRFYATPGWVRRRGEWHPGVVRCRNVSAQSLGR
jgi:hypothetical protein